MSDFHFLHIYWLIFIPISFFIIYFLPQDIYNDADYHKYRKFIAKRNFNFLANIGNSENSFFDKRKKILWLVFFSLIFLSLAQPRFRYKETKLYSSTKNLVILLDSSLSMGVSDLKPNRFKIAKHKIINILDNLQGYRVALIAFTEIPHIITPWTDDLDFIKEQLESLNLADFHIQGSNVKKALQVANNFFNKVIDGDKTILLLSDGEFENKIGNDIKLAKDIKFFAYGVGTEIGGPVLKNGNILKINNKKIISKLNLSNLKNIANQFGGDATKLIYGSNDIFFSYINNQLSAEKTTISYKVWQEDFVLLLFLAMIILFFLQGKKFFTIIFAMFFILNIANEAKANIFLNKEQNAYEKYQQKKYQESVDGFKSFYNQGVAEYRAGNYKKSIDKFKNSDSSPYKNYNLANSYYKAGDYQNAIESYQDFLKDNVNHQQAKHNLTLAEKQLKKQKQNKQKDNKNKQNDKQQKNNDKKDQKEDKKEDKKTDKNKQKSKKNSNENDKSSKKKEFNADKNIFDLIEGDNSSLLKKKIRRKDLQEGKKIRNQQIW